MLNKNGYSMNDDLLSELANFLYKKTNEKNYGNARTMRNALESLYQIQAYRTISNIEDRTINEKDLEIYYKENDCEFY